MNRVVRPTVAAMVLAAAVGGLAGCGSSPYRAECERRVNIIFLPGGLTRDEWIARCEKQPALRH